MEELINKKRNDISTIKKYITNKLKYISRIISFDQNNLKNNFKLCTVAGLSRYMSHNLAIITGNCLNIDQIRLELTLLYFIINVRNPKNINDIHLFISSTKINPIYWEEIFDLTETYITTRYLDENIVKKYNIYF
jgi:hypothetical protein